MIVAMVCSGPLLKGPKKHTVNKQHTRLTANFHRAFEKRANSTGYTKHKHNTRVNTDEIADE
jgi:hypothetical protein